MSPALEKSLVLLILMAAGFVAGKSRVLTREATTGLSRFLVDLALPALIIMSMQQPLTQALRDEAYLTLAVSTAVYALYLPLAWLLARILRAPPRARGTYAFAAAFSNVGFMGFPVMAALFGEASLFAVSVNNIPFQVLAFSLGVLMIASAGAGSAEGSRPRLGPRNFINPAVVASLLGFILFLASIRIPQPLAGALEGLGSVTTPLSMAVIGAILSRARLGALFGSWRAWALAAWRLLVFPLALFAILRALGASGMVLAVPVVVGAMPVAANTSILAEVYGGDAEVAAGLVFLSTLLSMLSIPLLAALLFGV